MKKWFVCFVTSINLISFSLPTFSMEPPDDGAFGNGKNRPSKKLKTEESLVEPDRQEEDQFLSLQDSPVQVLPREVMEHILSLVPPSNYLSVISVCRLFKILGESNAVYGDIFTIRKSYCENKPTACLDIMDFCNRILNLKKATSLFRKRTKEDKRDFLFFIFKEITSQPLFTDYMKNLSSDQEGPKEGARDIAVKEATASGYLPSFYGCVYSRNNLPSCRKVQIPQGDIQTWFEKLKKMAYPLAFLRVLRGDRYEAKDSQLPLTELENARGHVCTSFEAVKQRWVSRAKDDRLREVDTFFEKIDPSIRFVVEGLKSVTPLIFLTGTTSSLGNNMNSRKVEELLQEIGGDFEKLTIIAETFAATKLYKESSMSYKASFNLLADFPAVEICLKMAYVRYLFDESISSSGFIKFMKDDIDFIQVDDPKLFLHAGNICFANPLRDLKKALAYFARAKREGVRIPAYIIENIASTCFSLDLWSDAANFYVQAAKRYTDCWAKAAKAYIKLEEWGKAVECYERFFQNNPIEKPLEYSIDAGRACLRMDDSQKASEYALRAFDYAFDRSLTLRTLYALGAFHYAYNSYTPLNKLSELMRSNLENLRELLNELGGYEEKVQQCDKKMRELETQVMCIDSD